MEEHPTMIDKNTSRHFSIPEAASLISWHLPRPQVLDLTFRVSVGQTFIIQTASIVLPVGNLKDEHGAMEPLEVSLTSISLQKALRTLES